MTTTTTVDRLSESLIEKLCSADGWGQSTDPKSDYSNPDWVNRIGRPRARASARTRDDIRSYVTITASRAGEGPRT